MILESVVIVGFALLLDFLVGDPKTRYHPTAWIGKLIASLVPFTKSNSAKRELTGGILLVSIIVVTVCTVLIVLDIGISLLTIDIISLIVSIAVGSILLKTTIAIRGMQKHALAVVDAVEEGDLDSARNHLSMIVKRDTKNLDKNQFLLNERTGSELIVKKIAVRNPDRKRDVEVPSEILTTSWQDLVNDPEIDIIVELIGGVDEAFNLIAAALEANKVVVTGNKAVLAERGKELIEISEKQNTPLYCEAAVAGGIPIIKAVKEALIGNRITAIFGIINGTSNYILTRMTNAGITFKDALAEASEKGYAEADPSLDINGWDAGHKAIILGWLSYGHWLRSEEVSVEGIETISLDDVSFANDLGYEIKLLGVIRQSENDHRIEVRVSPTLIPKGHILSSVDGVFNAIAVHGDVVGETLFYGSGAGQDATSSAVISDLADAAENIHNEVGCTGFVPKGDFGEALPLSETLSQYYLRLSVADQPGVLGQIADITGKNNVGILSVIQPEPESSSEHIPLVLLLHDASYGTVQNALHAILALDSVDSKHTLLRVETLKN